MEDQLITKETAIIGEILGYPFLTYPNVPTQSLLQKWLREIHFIFIKVDLNPNDDTYSFYGDYKPNGVWTYIESDIENTGYKSYEDALEAGLLVGLKLIENKIIIKQV